MSRKKKRELGKKPGEDLVDAGGGNTAELEDEGAPDPTGATDPTASEVMVAAAGLARGALSLAMLDEVFAQLRALEEDLRAAGKPPLLAQLQGPAGEGLVGPFAEILGGFADRVAAAVGIFTGQAPGATEAVLRRVKLADFQVATEVFAQQQLDTGAHSCGAHGPNGAVCESLAGHPFGHRHGWKSWG